MTDKFNLKLCLVITCLTSNGIKVVSKDNELPSIDIHNGDNIDEVSEGYFSDITRLCPQWANLKFRKFHIANDMIVVFYSATLVEYDQIFQNFKWYDGIENINCYGLDPRSVIHV